MRFKFRFSRCTVTELDYMTIYSCSSPSCSSKIQLLRQSVSLNADNVYTFTTGFIEVTFTSYWFI